MENKKTSFALLSSVLLLSIIGFAVASSGISGSDSDREVRIEKNVNGLDKEVRVKIEKDLNDPMLGPQIKKELRVRVDNDAFDKELRIRVEKNPENNEVKIEVKAEKDLADVDTEFKLEKTIELDNGQLADVEVRAATEKDAYALLDWALGKLTHLKSMMM